MIIPPKYILTPKVSGLLSSIEASKQIIDSIAIPPEIEINIKRKSTLKSSLYSAKIEGNELTLDNLQNAPSQSQKKIEVYNILKALNHINETGNKDLNQKEVLLIHSLVMNGLADKENSKKFRKNMEAIFNSAGIAIYMPPPPRQIIPLIDRLVKYTNSPKETFIPIRAVIVHYIFEKIHPFLDGSGRVGRLLLQRNLIHDGYGMKGLLPLEEYLDNHRSAYYRCLEDPERDVTGYVEFMLEAIAETALEVRDLIIKKQNNNFLDSLLPRRAEIYLIIKDQLVNFNTLHRRFMAVNERTLRYDLKKLQDANLIRKRGMTKGVFYEISDRQLDSPTA